MSLLSICCTQTDEYNFVIKNNTLAQAYDQAGEDWETYTNITLKMTKINETTPALELDITSNFEYLFDCTGLGVAFEEFGESTFNGYAYWPDWLYTFTVTYTYNGTVYSTSYSVGFHALISRIVRQQSMMSNWKEEMACNCNCEKYSTLMRKWDYFWSMRVAAELCLIDEWHELLLALYKLTQTEHEFDT